MAFSIVLPLFFLLSLTLAQFSVPPPAGTPTAALPIYTNNANFETKWDSGYSNMGLVLWNNYVMEDGTQSIIRLIPNESPDPGSWSGPLQDIDLSQGSSFHLEVLELNSSGKETGNSINSQTFQIVPDAGSVSISYQTRTQTATYVTLQTSVATATYTPTNLAAAGTMAPSAVAAAIASASSLAYAQGMADQDSSGALPHSAVLGLGIGLGLGIPLLIAAVVAATLFFSTNSHRPLEMAETPSQGQSHWGTETTRRS